MKGVLVILDGLGDLPHKQLGDKTPLEVANMPNLSFLANRGEFGFMYPIKPGFIPSSDEAIVSIFGNELISSSRGQLEAKGAEIKLIRGDLALRANFGTIDSIESGNILDRRAGRTLTNYEAEQLAKEINKIKLPVNFIFKPTIQHRGVLILKGGFSDNLVGNDVSNYFQGTYRESNKINLCKPLDEAENSEYTVKVINDFIIKSYEVLKDHPVNVKRKQKGLMPANFIFLRDPGIEIPNLKKYKKWMSICYMPMEIGFSKLSGMETFSFKYPPLNKLDVYENLYDGLESACSFAAKTIEKYYKKFDYAYIHIKETDIPGHDNKPLEKKQMLEYVDKTLIKSLKDLATKNKFKIVITGDHSTPCKLKSHSADPVPVLLYNDSIPFQKNFNEKTARLGSLGRINGNELLKIIEFEK